MVENKEDKSGNKKLIKGKEYEAYDALFFQIWLGRRQTQ